MSVSMPWVNYIVLLREYSTYITCIASHLFYTVLFNDDRTRTCKGLWDSWQRRTVENFLIRLHLHLVLACTHRICSVRMWVNVTRNQQVSVFTFIQQSLGRQAGNPSRRCAVFQRNKLIASASGRQNGADCPLLSDFVLKLFYENEFYVICYSSSDH